MYFRPSGCKHIQPCRTLRLLTQRDKCRLPLSFAWSTSKVIPLDRMRNWVLTNGNGQRKGRKSTVSGCRMSTKGVSKVNRTSVFVILLRQCSYSEHSSLLTFTLTYYNTRHQLLQVLTVPERCWLKGRSGICSWISRQQSYRKLVDCYIHHQLKHSTFCPKKVFMCFLRF